MNILGLNFYYHDSTACLVKDGRLVIAIEEERLSRDKHTRAFPVLSAERCLRETGISYSDVDCIAVSIKPTLNAMSKVAYTLRHIHKSKSFLKHELINGRWKIRSFWQWYNQHWGKGGKKPKVFFVPHHLSHAAGSFFVSPYEEAALLGLDGAGEWATSFLGKGSGKKVECYHQSYFPMSLGSFYEAATEFCGFKPNYDEGKTMGLAPLGDHTVFYDKVAKLVKIGKDGQIKIDLSYFNYQYWGGRRFSQKFIDAFGEPRKGKEFADNHLNLAAAVQRVLEDRALELCDILYKRTGCRKVVIAGGVALNSVMNGRIVRESEFDDAYIMPAAGDNGTAIGAAYYVYNHVYKMKREFVHNNPYVGNQYSNEFIAALIKECKLNAEYHENITEVAAKYLHEGNILGWFQGPMEIGPRSLGNRSILANPTLPHMKDKINAEVKHREPYRPFAPSCTVEAKNDFFDLAVEAPFMLKVCNVLPEKRNVLPAITHVDGSARLQTVRKEINPRYHQLLSDFGKLSGVPVLLNTSFNIMGEPIVESPVNAIRCFFSTGLDILVLGNYLIKK